MTDEHELKVFMSFSKEKLAKTALMFKDAYHEKLQQYGLLLHEVSTIESLKEANAILTEENEKYLLEIHQLQELAYHD